MTDGALAELLPTDRQYKFAKSCVKWHKDTDIELSERSYARIRAAITDHIPGGMSGGPIVSENGSAIGMIATSGYKDGDIPLDSIPNPSLTHALPGWLLFAQNIKPTP